MSDELKLEVPTLTIGEEPKPEEPAPIVKENGVLL